MAVGFLDFSTKHAVCESTKLIATYAGAHIYNVKVAKDTDNGTVVGLGAWTADDYYVEAAAPTTFRAKALERTANGHMLMEVTVADGAVLLLNPELIYQEWTTQCQNKSNFFNAKDDLVRGYELVVHDMFALSDEGFTAAPVVGTTYKVDTATRKLVAA